MSINSLVTRIERLSKYKDIHNELILKRISDLSDDQAKITIENELPETIALNFLGLRQIVQLRTQLALRGSNLVRQNIPLEGQIGSLVAISGELTKNRIAAALHSEDLARQSNIKITPTLILKVLSGRKIRKMLIEGDLEYFKSLPQQESISVESFLQANKPIPMSRFLALKYTDVRTL
ncbi:hypothetical protein H1230_18770 [Paenibacillus sp. 19GGS1-52]|uniref:hypothetical protein n=1 Tax=Paenibacillus sp. 19GGS1-52 TaxID=2758563 RepID=UPI001EFAD09E|nr:hypothetical protein [Paenibacillus sp. 19GGS1-52]ULO05154.1 hypothetical protein H1230_18770 [Paenibacillus sp. 19GGS1-52]